jgi:hypothetical protein
MSKPTRTLYATQNAVIFPSGSNVDPAFYCLPINSVSLDVTNPIENVLVFGTLGAAARVQKEPSKTRMSIKSYLVAGSVSGGLGASLPFDATAVGVLTGNSITAQAAEVRLEPYGFTGYGILTKLDLDASTNNFVTLDLTFEGLGTPNYGGINTAGVGNTSYAGQIPVITGVQPVTSDLVAAGVISTDSLFTGAIGTNITGLGNAACVNSAKFSLDIPTDTIMCLGSQITGNQLAVQSGNVMIAKPPFKATLVVEGTAATACDAVDFGTIVVSLPTPRLISNTVNQSVGAAGVTYNYTVEDITATFSPSTITGVAI